MGDWGFGGSLRRQLQTKIEAVYSDGAWLDLVLPKPEAFKPNPSIRVGCLDILTWLDHVGDLTFYLGIPRDLFDEVDRNPLTPWEPGVPHRNDGVRRLVESYLAQKREYQQAVFRQLRVVVDGGTSASGSALMQEIRASKRGVEIRPYLLSGHSDWNAYAGIVGGQAMENQHAKGCAFGKANGKDWVGTSHGDNDIIHYTAQMWEPEGRPRIAGPGTLADEVLFHELVHSSRNTKGINCQKPVTGDYDDAEEFIAIAITNIYLSEKGHKLRADHRWGTELSEADARVWYRENPQKLNVHPGALIEQFKQQQESFYRALTKIPSSKARFNPVREHFEEGVAIQSHFERLRQSVKAG